MPPRSRAGRSHASAHAQCPTLGRVATHRADCPIGRALASAERQLWRDGTTAWEGDRVGVHLGRASGDGLSTLLARCVDDALTYEPAGGSLTDVTPPGLHRRHWETTLRAEDAFDRASEVIRSWKMHRGAGLVVAADGPIAVGTNVAMSA